MSDTDACLTINRTNYIDETLCMHGLCMSLMYMNATMEATQPSRQK